MGPAEALRRPAEPPVRAGGRERALRLHRTAGGILREPQAVRAGEIARVRPGCAGRVRASAGRP